MTLEEFQTELELERAWREEDIRFFHNLQAKLDIATDRKRLRRSIVGMQYAHIEGFVYFCFSRYAESINEQNLKCKDVKPEIAAASMHKIFTMLRRGEKKSPLFKRALPDDSKLHQTCREIDFLENMQQVSNTNVKIPTDFINTENNVGPDVLKKLLYQMGLNHTDLDDIGPDLLKLLNIRNKIAHGKCKKGISDEDYEKYKNCFNAIISKLSNLIVQAVSNQEYLLAS